MWLPSWWWCLVLSVVSIWFVAALFSMSTCLILVAVCLLWLIVGSLVSPTLLVLPHCHFWRVGSNSSWQLGKWCLCLVYSISLFLAATSLILLRTLRTFRCFWTISNSPGKMICFSQVPSILPLSLMDAFCHSVCRPVLCCTSFVLITFFLLLFVWYFGGISWSDGLSFDK